MQKKAFLVEQVSSIIQNNIPPKFKDPGYPTISCIIGNYMIDKALLDLGASVNLLSYSVYKQLGLRVDETNSDLIVFGRLFCQVFSRSYWECCDQDW